jgi:hypothetical protein
MQRHPFIHLKTPPRNFTYARPPRTLALARLGGLPRLGLGEMLNQRLGDWINPRLGETLRFWPLFSYLLFERSEFTI